MNRLMIEPGQGIGHIQLGMTKAEVEEWLQYYTEQYEIAYVKNPKYYQVEGAIRSCFTIEYDVAGKVTFIQIASELKEVLQCVFMDFDVFRTKAEDLVAQIDKLTPYARDHWELGFTYDFPALGLSFWRPSILNDADLEAEWFKEMDPEIQNDEMKNLYFECVSVRSLETEDRSILPEH